MTFETQKELDITTVDGKSDLSAVQPTDYLAIGPGDGRAILLSAGEHLTADRTPVAEAPDGVTQRLDGNQVIKLGGEVLAIAPPLAKK